MEESALHLSACFPSRYRAQRMKQARKTFILPLKVQNLNPRKSSRRLNPHALHRGPLFEKPLMSVRITLIFSCCVRCVLVYTLCFSSQKPNSSHRLRKLNNNSSSKRRIIRNPLLSKRWVQIVYRVCLVILQGNVFNRECIHTLIMEIIFVEGRTHDPNVSPSHIDRQ